MTIETYDKTYNVIQHRENRLDKNIYLCKNKEDNQLYTIIQLKDKKITASVLEFLCDQKRNTKFSDYVEYFVYKEDLHVVFHSGKGIPLEEHLKQICTLEERMEIGKRLLEKLVIFQLPSYFLCQCLEPSHIFVTDSLEVMFDYTLDSLGEYDTFTYKQAEAYLYRILKSLFRKELKNKVIVPMESFLNEIQSYDEFDCLGIYKSYCGACDEIKKIPKEELLVSRNWTFLLWEKVKVFCKVIRGSVLLLLFLGVFIYMVYSIWNSFQIKGYQKNYHAIGTVEIDDDGIEEDNR